MPQHQTFPFHGWFFRCLPTSDTYVRKTYQILGVDPPLMHNFSNYVLHWIQRKCNYIFILCWYVRIYTVERCTILGGSFNSSISSFISPTISYYLTKSILLLYSNISTNSMVALFYSYYFNIFSIFHSYFPTTK